AELAMTAEKGFLCVLSGLCGDRYANFATPAMQGSADSRKITSYRDMMPVLELITSSGLGSLLGMRHALEPGHFSAVSTLVSRERSGCTAAAVGGCWGMGHLLP